MSHGIVCVIKILFKNEVIPVITTELKSFIFSLNNNEKSTDLPTPGHIPQPTVTYEMCHLLNDCLGVTGRCCLKCNIIPTWKYEHK